MTNNISSTSDFNVDEFILLCDKLDAKNKVRKIRAYFRFLGVSCNFCGASIDYLEEPEKIVVCPCVLKEIEKHCIKREPDNPFNISAIAPLSGIRIDLKEPGK